jgi:hypothetical protein
MSVPSQGGEYFKILLAGTALSFRQPEEEFFAIRKNDVSANGTSGTIFRLVALYGDVGSCRQRFLRQAESVQIVRASPFDHPSDDLAVGALDIDVNPGVIGLF